MRPRTLPPVLLALFGVLAGCPPNLGGDDDDSVGDDDDTTLDDDDATDDDDTDDDDDDDITDDDDDITGDDDDDGQTYCAEGFTADAIREVVYFGPKVPPGYYADTVTSAQWFAPCSDSLATTEANAAAQWPGSTATGNSGATDWDYEAERTLEGTLLTYRNTQCAVWDGSTLAVGDFATWEQLQALVGYLWWRDNHNLGGAHILGGSGQIGNATDFFELCHVTTVFGDFGLQDEITVWSSASRISQVGGAVDLGDPVSQGIVWGNWN